MTERDRPAVDKLQTRLIWQGVETPVAREADWRRIGALHVDEGPGRNHLTLGTSDRFRLIKLRSRGAAVEVRWWNLRLEQSAILDLSVNCLPKGTDSHSIFVDASRLMEVVVDYDAHRASKGSRLEIWGLPWQPAV